MTTCTTVDFVGPLVKTTVEFIIVRYFIFTKLLIFDRYG